MDVAVIGGTGAEGFGLSLRLASAGHRVTIGSRDAQRGADAARRALETLADTAHVTGTTNEAAAASVDVLMVTVPFAGQADIYRSIAGSVRPGAVVMDATSPLATAVGGRAWQVLRPWHGSAAEQAAALLGEGPSVVAAFHTIAAHTLADLEHPVDSDVLVCSDDDDAKAVIGGLIGDIPDLRWIDCGALSMARITETLTPLLINVNRRYKIKDSGFRIVGREGVGLASVTDEGGLVRIDDTALWVVDRGEGYPVLVLHGGPGLDHHEFADYLDPLTERGYRLLLVDLRACGRSEVPPERSWTLERHAQDVIMLARALRLDRYAVLGHSFGAFVALQNAVDYQGMAAQTIVSSGVASMRWLEAVEPNLLSFEPASLRRQVADSWAREPEVHTPEEFASVMVDQFPFHFADPVDPRIDDYLARTSGTVYAPDVLRHFATTDAGDIELEDRLNDVTSPMLVLAGRHDRTCVPEAAEAIAALVPRSELVVFERSGHMAFVEEHDAYLAAVFGFLERHRDPS